MCMGNNFIKLSPSSLWNVCTLSASHISCVGVPVLLQCVTLAGGADVFCALLRDQFQHQDQEIRFAAVERVAVIIRLLHLCLCLVTFRKIYYVFVSTLIELYRR